MTFPATAQLARGEVDSHHWQAALLKRRVERALVNQPPTLNTDHRSLDKFCGSVDFRSSSILSVNYVAFAFPRYFVQGVSGLNSIAELAT